jgi:hypothetical protein
MKIRVKHKETEIEIDDVKVNHNIDLISIIKAISLEIQSIENNYNQTTYGDDKQ